MKKQPLKLPFDFGDVLALLGGALITFGIFLIYPPAAAIAGGVLLILAARFAA